MAKEPAVGKQRIALIVLMVVGAVVLLGQLWPAGAPPFARGVNIIWVLLVLGYLGSRMTGRL